MDNAFYCSTFHQHKSRVEFHVSRKARELYEFDQHLFSATGNVIFADFRAARIFADKINKHRDLLRLPESAVKASQINCMGLIDEVLHIVVELYRQQVNPKVMEQAAAWLADKVGTNNLQETLRMFVQQFPVLKVYRGNIDVEVYLQSTTAGVSNDLIVLEELMMLWLSNKNPGFRPCRELFDDDSLDKNSSYLTVIDNLKAFFIAQPTFGPEKVDLFTLLRLPALKHPHSLEGQLQYMLEHWSEMLKDVILRLLGGIDLIKEENKPGFLGPAPAETLHFTGQEHDPERFTADLDWMPNLVLMAKSTLVWLDQLSKKYGRHIHRLEQIPDEELNRLASWGITGLWLIGIWERSPASKQIKQMCGNPEAESSAYSLFDYEVAHELGGEPALTNLHDRCWQRGIRLGCDMVPNHTGIDSRWLRDHPDWYISLPFSPFPAYSFNGVNLSQDPRYGIYIDDHYYDRTDAAVVFKRVDNWSGDVRYIYHGNDGTSMPWNDTAQLDYLNPEVREAVINKIVDVARKFPVIRFDAAMTLANVHFHRLWYPEPGSGGDIPSRSEFGMSRHQFDEQVQSEFWREVVDRVAEQAPDSLLLAEAFWLMESYFVRTLGMHRVYNSAFMHMLKNEENQKYRETVINTLQFNPEILKRYVNFMNNPDEETAIDQFGDGDKYFGVCTMLVTMPGLPMLGHGQVEGYHEKYGMEYRRAYYEEQENTWLVQRHEREIFPLLKKRYLFAGINNFLFYDFVTPGGEINHNVFAYSNSAGGERGLIIYNNKFEQANGWVRASVPFAEKADGENDIRLVKRSLCQGLALTFADNVYFIFRDQVAGLEYLRNSKQVCEQGLYFELGAFKYVVVTEMSEVVEDEAFSYGQLCARLNGRGVTSIPQELKEMQFAPFLDKLDLLLNPPAFAEFMSMRNQGEGERSFEDYLQEFHGRFTALLNAHKQLFVENYDTSSAVERTLSFLRTALIFDDLVGVPAKVRVAGHAAARRFLRAELSAANWPLFYCWLVLHSLAPAQDKTDGSLADVNWLHERLISKRVTGLLESADRPKYLVDEEIQLLSVMLGSTGLFLLSRVEPGKALSRLFDNPHARACARVNRFEDIVWFNKEGFEKMGKNLFLQESLDIFTANVSPNDAARPSAKSTAQNLVTAHKTVLNWLNAAENSGYRLQEILRLCA